MLEARPDIFKAWNHNLDNERRKGRRVARKLSHRAQRKEFLKQHSYPKVTGTLHNRDQHYFDFDMSNEKVTFQAQPPMRMP